MTKNYFTLLLIIICFTANSYAQVENHAPGRVVFKDARDIMTNPEKRDTILLNYFNSNAEIEAFNRTYGFTLAPFSGRLTDRQIENIRTTSVQGDFGLGAILNPTTAIDALGSVIAERFKQEINIAFLKKFKDELETQPYLGLLFPESKNVLVASDPYNYPVFMTALRDAFKEDADNLIKNLPAVITYLKPNDPKMIALASLLSMLGDDNASGNIITTFNRLATEYAVTNDQDFKKVLYIMAFSLNAVNKGGSGEAMFISSTDMPNFSKPAFTASYFPLLVRQNEKYLNEIAGTINTQQIISFITEIVPLFKTVSDEAKFIASQNAKNELTTTMILNSSSKVLESVKKAVDAYKKNINPKINTDVFDTAYMYSGSVIKIARFIDEKKYGLAFVELTQYIGYIQGNYDTERFSRFKKYTGFMANALAAENKEQLMDALETSANPVGSYRIKRNSTFNIAINAYAGGFGGIGPKDAVVYGFTAPVGIYLGWGNLFKKDAENPLKGVDGKSFGVFLPIVDVGAVTAFRLQDDETEMADVTWNNVFSPGAYLTYGFGKCPLSLSIGGQMGPELTKINSDGTPEFVKKEWYWRVAAVIDIPLYDLYTKQRSYDIRLEQDEDNEEIEEIKKLEDLRKKEERERS